MKRFIFSCNCQPSKFIFGSGSQIMFFTSISLPVIICQIMLPEKYVICSRGLVASKQEQN